MTKHAFLQHYRKIALPLMIQGIITTLISMIDTLMVGQLGDNAISAVSISNRILQILFFSLLGIVSATGVFIAQYYGARNKAKQKEMFHISLLLTLGLLLIGGIVIILFHPAIIHFFVKDSVVESLAASYIGWLVLAYIPLTLSLNFSTPLKVIGQVKLPLIASLLSVVVNTSFNYMLILGNFGFPALGVKGAAIATALARLVEFTVLYSVTRHYHYDFYAPIIHLFNVSRETIKEVVKKALPLLFNELIWSFGMATILKLYATRGSEVIAAYALADATSAIFFSATQGMNAATSVFISQQLGAGHFKEAEQNARRMLKLTFAMSVFLGIGMIGASFIVPNLSQLSERSHEIATRMIQVMGCMYWVYLITTQTYFILRAGGDMRSTLFMDGGFMWLITIPIMASVAYLTPASIYLLYFAGQGCDLLKLLTAQYFYRKKRWLNNLAQ